MAEYILAKADDGRIVISVTYQDSGQRYITSLNYRNTGNLRPLFTALRQIDPADPASAFQQIHQAIGMPTANQVVITLPLRKFKMVLDSSEDVPMWVPPFGINLSSLG